VTASAALGWRESLWRRIVGGIGQIGHVRVLAHPALASCRTDVARRGARRLNEGVARRQRRRSHPRQALLDHATKNVFVGQPLNELMGKSSLTHHLAGHPPRPGSFDGDLGRELINLPLKGLSGITC